MRQNISIYNITEKKSKKGKQFWTTKTNKGDMSIWDKDIADKMLKEGIRKVCDLETEENNGFTNITLFNGAYGPVDDATEKIQDDSANRTKQASMIISYAKDIAVAEIQALIGKCKDIAEAKELITTIEAKLFEHAKGLMELHKELIK